MSNNDLSLAEARWNYLVWNLPIKTIHKALLHALFRFYRRYKGNLFVSTERLAEMAGVHPETAKKELRTLEASGWFSRSNLGKGHTGRVYSYTLTLAKWMDAEQKDFLKRVTALRHLGKLSYRVGTDDNWINWGDSPDLIKKALSAGLTLADLAEEAGVSEEDVWLAYHPDV